MPASDMESSGAGVPHGKAGIVIACVASFSFADAPGRKEKIEFSKKKNSGN